MKKDFLAAMADYGRKDYGRAAAGAVKLGNRLSSDRIFKAQK